MMKKQLLTIILSSISAVAFAAVNYSNQNISGLNFTGSSYDSTDFTNSDFSGATIGTSYADSHTTTFSSSTSARDFSGSDFSGIVIGMADPASPSTSTKAVFDYATLKGANFSGMTINSVTFEEDGEEDCYIGCASFKNATIENSNFSNITFTNGYMSFAGSNVRLDFSNATLENVKIQNIINVDILVNNDGAIKFSGANLTNVDFRTKAGYSIQSLSFSGATTKNVIGTGMAANSVAVTNLELNSADDILTICTHEVRAVKLSSNATFSGGTLEFVDKKSSTDNALLEVGNKTLTLTADMNIDVYLASDFDFTEDTTFTIISTGTSGQIILDGLTDVATIIRVMSADGVELKPSQWTANLGSDLSISIQPIPEPATYAAIFGALALCLAVWRKRK